MARSGTFWAGVVLCGTAFGAVLGTAYVAATTHPVTHTQACTVTAADGGQFTRATEQANYAALVAAVAKRKEMGADASIVGVATAMQESGLRNLDYGDRDSLGLFQQRPSQGWGTEDEVKDPHHAARAFYAALARVRGWQDLSVTQAAQAVQRSAFPDAYAKHVPEATAWAQAVRGDLPFAAIDCDLDAVGTPGTVKAFTQRVQDDFGKGTYAVAVLARNDRAVLLGITATSGTQSDLDAIANWCVAVADAQSVASVRLGHTQWLRERGVETADTTSDSVLVGIVTAVRD